MRYRIVFDPAAKRDVDALFDYVAANAGRAVARRYLGRLLDYCARFNAFPARGTRHDDIGPGIRIVGFERRATIVFRIDGNVVTVLRILYAGRSHDAAENDATD